MQTLHVLCSLPSNCSTSYSIFKGGRYEHNILQHFDDSLPVFDVCMTANVISRLGTVGPCCSCVPVHSNTKCFRGYVRSRHVQLPRRRHSAGACVQKQTLDSSDEEYRSARGIALSIHRRYQNVLNGGFSNNLKEFITACVTAYAVGCTEAGLKEELLSAFQQFEDANAELQAKYPEGLRYKTGIHEVEECILWLSLVFITILCASQSTIIRWSQTPAVSSEVQSQWQGFCAIIANAYYNRGMAWLPVKVLQLEQIAISGHAEEASLVADRMRLVFATLENISPQWPKR